MVLIRHRIRPGPWELTSYHRTLGEALSYVVDRRRNPRYVFLELQEDDGQITDLSDSNPPEPVVSPG